MKINPTSAHFLIPINNSSLTMPINAHKIQKSKLSPKYSPNFAMKKSYKNSSTYFVYDEKKNFHKEGKKRSWHSKKNRRDITYHNNNNKEKPPTPHNTTQFIVNSVSYPIDPYSHDNEDNKLGGCGGGIIRNHSMIGSMMDLMKNRICLSKSTQNINQDANMNIEIDNDNILRKAAMVNDINEQNNNFITPLCVKDNKDSMNPRQLLNLAKHTHCDIELQNIISKMYDVIKQKDALIKDLTLERNNSS